MKKEGSVSLLNLLLTFTKLGLFSFGGGATMVTLLEDELVEKKKWISNDELVEMTAIAETTPGPIAINLATYLGYKKRGVIGSIMATLGVVIPTFLIMFVVSLFLRNLMQYDAVKYAFMGIKCGVIFLILRAAIHLMKSLKGDYLGIAVLAIVTILTIVFGLLTIDFSAIYFILIGALVGILFYAIFKNRKGDKK